MNAKGMRNTETAEGIRIFITKRRKAADTEASVLTSIRPKMKAAVLSLTPISPRLNGRNVFNRTAAHTPVKA